MADVLNASGVNLFVHILGKEQTSIAVLCGTQIANKSMSLA